MKRSWLNLALNADGVLECRGRIKGKFPVYLPADGLFTRELVQRIHVETLHGGLTLTMAAIREEYWTPKLRKLVKSVRSACCCWGCKSFQASPLTVQRPEPLPTDRTIGGAEFKVIGTAFVGSLKYKQHKKSKGKAYRAIFSCSLSRAVQQELMSSMETSHFITSFKCLIACHGRQSHLLGQWRHLH